LKILILILILSSGSLAMARLVLVYRGPGACEQSKDSSGCAESAAAIALKAGFEVQFVGPEGLDDPTTWRQASAWIQPGGLVKNQVLAMRPHLLNQIRHFVKAGGGYVGFCAGAFLAADHFGFIDNYRTGKRFESSGLGLIPGYAFYFDEFDSQFRNHRYGRILKTRWSGKTRYVYWELGPFFKAPQKPSDYEVVASYLGFLGWTRQDHVMALRSKFGKGRVFLSAVHPEAPQDWRNWYQLQDPDGLDTDLAIEMLMWVTPGEIK